jgi:rare lipoprotein A
MLETFAIDNSKASCIMKKTILSVLVLACCAGAASAETTEIQTGKASWYGRGHIGKRTASGEIFTGKGHTAAHRTLPLGAVVRVLDSRTGRSVVVRINDRGPYVGDRIIDLSERAATDLGLRERGVGEVTLEILALR